MRAAIELLLEVGPAPITAKIRSLNDSLRLEIASCGFEFLSPTNEKHCSGILTFRHPEIPTERLVEALLKDNVVVSLRVDRAERRWLRISPHFYNTFEEIAKVAGILQKEWWKHSR